MILSPWQYLLYPEFIKENYFLIHLNNTLKTLKSSANTHVRTREQLTHTPHKANNLMIYSLDFYIDSYNRRYKYRDCF